MLLNTVILGVAGAKDFESFRNRYLWLNTAPLLRLPMAKNSMGLECYHEIVLA